MGLRKRVALNKRLGAAITIGLATTLLLTACGPTPGDARPDNSTLISGINLLINNFEQKHPKLVNWNSAAVKKQLKATLPVGEDTDAGWLLQWPTATAGQLDRVIIPWTLLGQYPNNPKPLGYRYQGGSTLPQSTVGDITQAIYKAETQGDQYFAAVVDVRASKNNPQWIIFSTEPYLPVTDPAYGFATVINKQWAIVDFGTATVGCGKVPAEVESEFGFRC
jgi:hypothetical protein